VLCAWGFTDEGERILVGVCLGMRESHEDWLALGRDLIARGLPAPMLIVADGAPSFIVFWSIDIGHLALAHLDLSVEPGVGRSPAAPAAARDVDQGHCCFSSSRGQRST
jgi:hypothetical protein